MPPRPPEPIAAVPRDAARAVALPYFIKAGKTPDLIGALSNHIFELIGEPGEDLSLLKGSHASTLRTALPDEQPPVAEPAPLIGKIAQPGTQFRIGRTPRAIPDHRAIGGSDRAGPSTGPRRRSICGPKKGT